jgi:hypothetical protein
MTAHTFAVDTEAVVAYVRSALDNPAHLAAAADGLRQRTLGPLYFTRPDSVFWHEMSASDKAPWIERARAEFEALS